MGINFNKAKKILGAPAKAWDNYAGKLSSKLTDRVIRPSSVDAQKKIEFYRGFVDFLIAAFTGKEGPKQEKSDNVSQDNKAFQPQASTSKLTSDGPKENKTLLQTPLAASSPSRAESIQDTTPPQKTRTAEKKKSNAFKVYTSDELDKVSKPVLPKQKALQSKAPTPIEAPVKSKEKAISSQAQPTAAPTPKKKFTKLTPQAQLLPAKPNHPSPSAAKKNEMTFFTFDDPVDKIADAMELLKSGNVKQISPDTLTLTEDRSSNLLIKAYSTGGKRYYDALKHEFGHTEQFQKAQAQFDLVMMAHAFAIDELSSDNTKLSGFKSKITHRLMQDSFASYSKTTHGQGMFEKYGIDPKRILVKLDISIASMYVEDKNQIASQLEAMRQKGEWFILHVNVTNSHATTYGFYGNTEGVCNRGKYRDTTDKSQEGKEITEGVQLFNDIAAGDGKEGKIRKLLDPIPNREEWQGLTTGLAKTHAVKQVAQKMGNCTWANLKSGLLMGLMFELHKSDPDTYPLEGNNAQHTEKSAREIYRDWSLHDRFQRLQSFTDNPYHNEEMATKAAVKLLSMAEKRLGEQSERLKEIKTFIESKGLMPQK